jgi:hypothetical protein
LHIALLQVTPTAADFAVANVDPSGISVPRLIASAAHPKSKSQKASLTVVSPLRCRSKGAPVMAAYDSFGVGRSALACDSGELQEAVRFLTDL